MLLSFYMNESSLSYIRKKLELNGSSVFLAWFFLVVLPFMAAFIGLDHFLSEYSIFSESSSISEAINEIENYKNAQVVENFLTMRLPELAQLQPDSGQQKHEKLKRAIDSILGGQSILCIFFNQDQSQLKSIVSRPKDLNIGNLPPAAIFRRQIEMLSKKPAGIEQTFEQMQYDEKTKAVNARQLQQIFKTLTPVSLRSERVVKNISARYDSDLYFLFCEFNTPVPQTAGFLAVIRGKEISGDFILQSLKKEFPLCRTVFRPKSVFAQSSLPAGLLSGVERHEDRLLITAPADQRFMRHMLHGGGIQLQNKAAEFNLPFIQYHLPLTRMHHSLETLKKPFRWLAGLVILLSGFLCVRAVMSGMNLKSSFKKRILTTTGLAAILPFIFFTVSLYLHQQYDEFLQRINLIQHISTKIALINNEIDQYFAKLEGEMSIYLQRLEKINLDDQAMVDKIFTEIGEEIPVARISVQTVNGNIQKNYPARRSSTLQNDATGLIEKFLPMHSLLLLRETGPLDRKPKDILQVPGEQIKVAFIGSSLVSNGSFIRVDQNEFPIWITYSKIQDGKSARNQVTAILSCRIEPPPFIKAFFNQSQMAKNNYEEVYGAYRIKYGFFPVEQSGSGKIWNGSGHIDDPDLQMIDSQSQTTTSIKKTATGEKVSVSKINPNVPHKAVACAVSEKKIPALNTTVAVIIGCLVYLTLVLVVVNGLLDMFFVKPVSSIAATAEQIARGKDLWDLHIGSGDELERLNKSFQAMVKGLQERNMLKNYVSADAYEDLAASSTAKLAPGGEYREATIVFAAIKNYENLTVNQSPAQAVACLSRFMTICDRLVKENSGSFDKIMGSTLMLVFRESEGEKESHALRAARTALKLSQETSQTLSDGILAGISSGTVISGKIGSYTGKLDFTVIGSPVNLAARLKTEAVDSSTGIIISGSTMRLLKGRGRVNFLRRCSLKGKAREYNIYELCELRENQSS